MQLDRDHSYAGVDQRGGDHAGSSPNVEDEVAGAQVCIGDEVISLRGLELVPGPPAAAGGHGGP